MARFKKSKSEGTPGLNTGSMSDIVFMFLFFFMVITNMRESSLYIKIKVPQASEVQKLEKACAAHGEPLPGEMGSAASCLPRRSGPAHTLPVASLPFPVSSRPEDLRAAGFHSHEHWPHTDAPEEA